MKNAFLLVIIVFLGFIISSCDEDIIDPSELYHEYFPVGIGHYIIYDVDSVYYNDFTGEIESYNYQVKEVIESEFIDADDHPSLRLERYFRANESDDWVIKNVWKSRLNYLKALKTEENVTFIKLSFPPEENKTWDGNAFNSYPALQYKFQDVHKAFSMDGFNADSTVTVIQMDFQTLISEDYKVEVYAKHVGLVYKKFVELVKEVDGTITSGVDYSYLIIESGVE